MKVTRVREMRSLDRYAIEKLAIPEEILMENAGEASYFVILDKFGIKNKKFVIICGIGNNGGDGFVVARKIHSNGGDVKVFILGNVNKYKGAAKKNFDIISRLEIDIRHIESIKSIKSDVLDCDAIVDAIFGTGLARNVESLHKNVIQLINKSRKKVLSVDIPSGINGDTGKIMGVSVKADYTVTFGLPKIGNLLFPGYEHCGKLYVSHISFPPSLHNQDSIKVEINDYIKLPPKDKISHKGNFGKVLFIAGASNYFGAPYFSALSFLKSGGGYSRLAAPISVTPFIAIKGSEIVFIPQKETDSGSISLKNRDELLELSEKMDMVVIGPGISLNEETQQLTRELAKRIEKPLLIDGDGITAISKDLDTIKERKKPTILTPHLGEMSRITKMSVSDLDKNKIDVLQSTSKELNSIIVLKGAHSLIGYPDEKVYINMSGNPGMASAGSGDVLTGTIAAMFGLGLSIENAVRKAVFIHGFSGDLAAKDLGEDGITAQDILDYLPIAMKIDREGPGETLKVAYKGAHVI
ncbi:MAG: bifunctional ADP-dependent NAD(P)H-hydrate dehydratase/NAD(P)H-hydrate epimerase [Deltaproteobacteria bacterium]|nr:MAG: bifunctional ADP-dependent NAD(P)H-hydrate dehydratase/NAD(P)H-hydrate epimerase [Deltaproteobacteria bacterium]